jgi:transposase
MLLPDSPGSFVFPVSLSPEEENFLHEVASNPESKNGHLIRARLVRLASQGLPVQGIAKQCGLDITVVRMWLRRFQRKRLGIFAEQSHGVEKTEISDDGDWISLSAAAQRAGLYHSSVQEVIRAHGLPLKEKRSKDGAYVLRMLVEWPVLEKKLNEKKPRAARLNSYDPPADEQGTISIREAARMADVNQSCMRLWAKRKLVQTVSIPCVGKPEFTHRKRFVKTSLEEFLIMRNLCSRKIFPGRELLKIKNNQKVPQ